MSHVEVIITQKVLPPPGTQVTAEEAGEMTASVKYTPADSMTDAQIGHAVERIVRRLTKLADD